MSDLKKMVLERDAKIGQLLIQLEEYKQKHAQIIGEYEIQVGDLKVRLEEAEQKGIDAIHQLSANCVEKGKEAQFVINRVCQVSRRRQISAMECNDEIDSVILMHEHKVLVQLIEEMKGWLEEIKRENVKEIIQEIYEPYDDDEDDWGI